MYVTDLDAGKSVGLPVGDRRSVWVQVARGSVSVNGTPLGTGDGAAITGEKALEIAATESAEVIVFDLA
jgi:redox-sensitive bicupin YhaK (pirin superfamily)